MGPSEGNRLMLAREMGVAGRGTQVVMRDGAYDGEHDQHRLVSRGTYWDRKPRSWPSVASEESMTTYFIG